MTLSITKFSITILSMAFSTRNTNCRGRVNTVDYLIKVACFVKKGKWYFQYKKQLTSTCQYKEINRAEPSPSVRLFSITTLSRITLSMTLSIKTLNATLSITSLNTVCWHADCHFAQYYYAQYTVLRRSAEYHNDLRCYVECRQAQSHCTKYIVNGPCQL